LTLKKKKEGEVAVPTEVLTIYGTFVNEMNKYEEMPIEPPTVEENGADKFRKHFVCLRKLRRLIVSFPDTGSRDTQRLATTVVDFLEHSLQVVNFSSGLRMDNWQRDYYKRLKDRSPEAMKNWKAHLKNIELVMKPATQNVIA
jgi:hypothetical protein